MEDVLEFLAHAIALENEAAERYEELADTMETHHNDVATLFRKMAHYSRLHRAEAERRASSEGRRLPELKPWEYRWPGAESPESGAIEDSHYLMTAHHALTLAFDAECRARDFYSGVAKTTTNARVRELASEFASEEAEHAATLEQWLTRHPEPAEDWHYDPDPPRAAD